MVAARLARQAIFDRATPPNVSVILDKSVLHRLIGSPQVMYDALMHVVEPEVAQVLQVERRWRGLCRSGGPFREGLGPRHDQPRRWNARVYHGCVDRIHGLAQVIGPSGTSNDSYQSPVTVRRIRATI
jgi:hypothetical protein